MCLGKTYCFIKCLSTINNYRSKGFGLALAWWGQTRSCLGSSDYVLLIINSICIVFVITALLTDCVSQSDSSLVSNRVSSLPLSFLNLVTHFVETADVTLALQLLLPWRTLQ